MIEYIRTGAGTYFDPFFGNIIPDVDPPDGQPEQDSECRPEEDHDPKNDPLDGIRAGSQPKKDRAPQDPHA